MRFVLTALVGYLCCFSFAVAEDFRISIGRSKELVFRNRDLAEESDLYLVEGDKEIFLATKNINVRNYNNRVASKNGVSTIELSTGNQLRIQLKDFAHDAFHLTFHHTFPTNYVYSSCHNLSSEPGEQWYGGPQLKEQHWPIQTSKFTDFSYVTKAPMNTGVAERYWLSSTGRFIYYDLQTPLFINQNVQANTVCFIAKLASPYAARPTYSFTETLAFGPNAKEAHKYAVDNFLHKPTGVPDQRMIQHPIWSTWARYGAAINQDIVLKYAKEIKDNAFNNSQIEIDDLWETCYGSMVFDINKFPDVKKLVEDLHALKFRVTLWIHPFINKDCEPAYTEALTERYLLQDSKNNTVTHWWNDNGSTTTHIDFTNPDAAKWFTDRLIELKAATGIDSFKFDAGETSWTPPDAVLTGEIQLRPHLLTQAYVREVSKFGSMIELRAGQNTQDLPVFIRMVDKDSNWSMNNGLPTLVTTLLLMNMVGYTLVLPDMVGGNGYDNIVPSKELFIRWLQANVFMPSIQFSITPWDYDEETIAISQTFTKLHAEFAELIEKQCLRSVELGEPVNAPIWWMDPTDRHAQKVNDEFLLGDYVLVAPVLIENATSRTIYLPKGKWMDGNDETSIIQGPTFIFDYLAPLNTLPYFLNVDSSLKNSSKYVTANFFAVYSTIIIALINVLL